MSSPWLMARGFAGVLAVLLLAGGALAGPLTMYDDRAEFETATGAVIVPIPLAETLIPSFGIPGWGCDEMIAMPFENNLLTLTAPNSRSEPTLPGIEHVVCIVNAGVTEHGFAVDPVSSTIVGDGEDDYELVFDDPVHSIGVELLTNNAAIEELIFRDEMGDRLFAVNVGPLTVPESFSFVGFESPDPVKSVFIDTTNGSQLNEGIGAILASDTYAECTGSGDPEDADGDGDGFPASMDCDDADPSVHPEAVDLPGDLLDEDCSGEAACDPCGYWRNHGHFVRCVTLEATALVDEGSLDPIDATDLVSQAARTDVGKRGHVPAECGGTPELIETFSERARGRARGLR